MTNMTFTEMLENGLIDNDELCCMSTIIRDLDYPCINDHRVISVTATEFRILQNRGGIRNKLCVLTVSGKMHVHTIENSPVDIATRGKQNLI